MPKQISWAVAAALTFVLAGNSSAQQTPPDPGAAANVRQSQQYEQVLNSNSSFRAKRMAAGMWPRNRSGIARKLRRVVWR